MKTPPPPNTPPESSASGGAPRAGYSDVNVGAGAHRQQSYVDVAVTADTAKGSFFLASVQFFATRRFFFAVTGPRRLPRVALPMPRPFWPASAVEWARGRSYGLKVRSTDSFPGTG